MSLEPGQVIGRYKVESTLGQGALAVTFKVVDPADGTPYALKMMYSRDEQFRERLRRAGEAQSRVVHPNLVRVVDTLEIEGSPGLVMEFVDGPTLEDWLKTGRPSLGLALKVFRGIVEGVNAAHAAGLVHRNLKPAKILLHREGDEWKPKVNDFALVKIEGAQKSGNKALTQLGVSFGTPQYMAPEQFRDVSGVDHRADLFALGAILYELVCGVRAFDGNNLLAIYQKSAQGQYRSPVELVPDLPVAVAEAIQKCLKVDPKLRPGSGEELLEMLYGGGKLDAVMAAPAVMAPAAPAPPPVAAPAPQPVAPVVPVAPVAPRPAVTPAVKPGPAPKAPLTRDNDIEAFEKPGRSTGFMIVVGLVLFVVVLPVVGSVLAGVAWYVFR